MKKNMTCTRIFGLMLATLLILTAPAFAIIYVDVTATGGNDGTSWTDAYTDLVSALNENTTEEIWVAAGTYDPDSDSSDTFQIDNHPVYGGFGTGAETMRSQRDPDNNICILSGALTGGGYATRVVQKTWAGTAVLDGFTITDGYGTSSADDGGAVRVTSGTITIADCIVTNNGSGDQGGAFSFRLSAVVDVIITNCTINNNSNTVNATLDEGGAIYVHSGVDSFTVSDCSFSGNRSDRDGGDIFIGAMSGDVTIRDTVFEGSRSVNDGGSCLIDSDGNNLIEGCTFTNVQTSATGAFRGGAVKFESTSFTPVHTVRNCTFSDVHLAGSTEGSALYADDGEVIITGTTFRDCTTSSTGTKGGAISIGGGSRPENVTISNCFFDSITLVSTITGTGSDQGGAIYVIDRDNITTITDCVFTNVAGAGTGGAIYSGVDKTNIVRDCTFHVVSNSFIGAYNGGAISLDSADANSEHSVLNCTFVNVRATGSQGGGALFVDDGMLTIDNCAFRDVAITDSGMAGDGGAMKIIGTGAGPIIITNCTFDTCVGSPLAGGDGGAIYIATKLDDVTITDCVFTNTTTASQGGAVYCDARGASTEVIMRDCTFNDISTTVSGAYEGGAAMFGSTVATIETTVKNCTFVDVSHAGSGKGAGLNIDDGIVNILNCTFRNVLSADTANDGGAIAIEGGAAGAVLVSNVTAINCHAGTGAGTEGGGIFFAGKQDNTTIVDCTFSNVSASSDGGALYFTATNPDHVRIIDRCSFYETSNTLAAADGGAIYFSDAASGSLLRNSLFAKCQTSQDGGAVHIQNGGSFLDVIHCTFATNTAGRNGGGLHTASASVSITNTLFFANEAATTGDELELGAAGVTEIDYSNLDQSRASGLDTVGGNMTNDNPSFVSVLNNQFQIQVSSLLKDAGLTLANVSVDRDGNVRPDSAASDIGAYEVASDSTPPGEVVSLVSTGLNASIKLDWTNPGDGDFQGVLITRVREVDSVTPNGTPVNGSSYTTNDTLGGDTIIHVGTASDGDPGDPATLTDPELLNGTTYVYRVFTFDLVPNYSTGSFTTNAPASDSTPPSAVTLNAEGQLAQVTLNWTNSAESDFNGVLITYALGSTAPTNVPTQQQAYTTSETINGDMILHVGTANDADAGDPNFLVHGSLADNQAYSYTIFAFDTSHNYASGASDTATTDADIVDPANVTGLVAAPGNAQVTLTWTNPADADLDCVLILLKEGGTISFQPGTPTNFNQGDDLGNGIGVAYKGSGSSGMPGAESSVTINDLTNSFTYFFRVFAKDEVPNYSSGGVEVSATPVFSGIHVDTDASGANDGSNWANAYKTLTNALANNSDQEIWVAEGSYSPGALDASTFDLQDNAVYGGFVGSETNRNERDPAANLTILDGGGTADTVVTKTDSGTATLDGFVVQDGNGTGSSDDGAGLHVTDGTLYLTDVTFTNNSSGRHGGAIYASGGSAMLAVSNCTFRDNDNKANTALGDGGAIYAHASIGDIDVADCAFEGNDSDDDGGDIYVGTANIDMTIENSTFVGSRGSGTQSEGGSIYSGNDGTHTLTSCTFRDVATSGTSTYYGGAIYFSDSAIQTNFFTDCHFNNCRLPSSSAAGGAISAIAGAFIMSDCTFTNTFCSASAGDGGAIDIRGGSAETDPVIISNCIFDATYAGSGAEGGAVDINNRAGIVVFSDCVFTNTYSGRNGGAISSDATQPTTIRDCTFNVCSNYAAATYHGAAVASVGNAANTFKDCTFDDTFCDTTGHGGAIYTGDGDLVIEGCTFKETRTNPNEATHGGAVYASQGAGDSILVSNCTFEASASGINSTGDGGAIHVQTPGSGATIVDCVFTNTRSGYYGGAAYINAPTGDTLFRDCDFFEIRLLSTAVVDGGALKVAGGATINETRFVNCDFEGVISSGTGGGGAIVVADGDTFVLNCTFDETSCSGGDGGALKLTGGAGDSATISNCTFTACDADQTDGNGGAMTCVSHADGVTIADVVITNTSAGYRGGAIHLSATGASGVNEIRNTTIRDVETITTINVQAGAIYINNGLSNHLINVTIDGVTHAGSGSAGAVLMDEGDILVSACTIRNVSATAASHGGGISIEGTAAQSVVVSNSTFENITCIGRGGAIYVTGRSAPVTIVGTTFKNNSATGSAGGAVYLTDGSAVRTIDSCRFEGNSADGAFDAGALYLDTPAAGSRVVNSVFVNNSLGLTSDDGGAIFQEAGAVDYLHCTFYTNTAADKGGAIYVIGGTASFTNCIFRGNQADPASEQIHATASAVTEINFCNVDQTQSTGLDTVGGTMFNTDPQFSDASNFDLTLLVGSPMQDAGTTLSDVTTDILGAARPTGAGVDIGAYELTATVEMTVIKFL